MKRISLLLIAIGIMFLVVGTVAYPMITLNVPDTTPPVWLTASDGTLALFPKSGNVISATLGSSAGGCLTAGVADPESGVTSVVCTIDNAASYTLALGWGTAYSGIWYNRATITLSSGLHTIKYVATNGAGLTLTYPTSGDATFTVYMALTGSWYVNDILITGATQVINVTSATVTFKFVKTVGAADSLITATVKEGATTLVTLTNTATATWAGSYTFTYGRHTLSLTASDGTTSVTMSMFNINFGGAGGGISMQIIMYIVGLTFILAGVVTAFIKGKPKIRR